MKIIKIIIIFYLFFTSNVFSNNKDFNNWVIKFKARAAEEGISIQTINLIMDNASYLPNVIKYDRFQPEFYEDTKTYINKRVNRKKINNGRTLYNRNISKIIEIEKKFFVEKELLLALMGIETNYGKYLGKMNIVSSLSTLSFDKRRSEFFTKELIILLKLVDKKIINPNILFGSWAGAFGNFQFMPRTIKDYAIDYDSNTIIELKKIDDSFASAANYLNKIGWKKNEPCFYRVELKENFPTIYLNTSAKKIKNKKKLIYFKKYIKNFDSIDVNKNKFVGIITPDKDIIPDSLNLAPAFIVFENFEIILSWNRSLRFALAVCTLKNNFKNEL
ncbi:lytic murein transglycosylase [Candidatus Pelagibacter sp.]|nr:lytic murein transglycosylase [Candidatus Pelagibacter sp.]